MKLELESNLTFIPSPGQSRQLVLMSPHCSLERVLSGDFTVGAYKVCPRLTFLNSERNIKTKQTLCRVSFEFHTEFISNINLTSPKVFKDDFFSFLLNLLMLYLKECVTFKIFNGPVSQIHLEIQHSYRKGGGKAFLVSFSEQLAGILLWKSELRTGTVLV